MREATIAPSVSQPSLEGETSFDDDLIWEVKGYTEIGDAERVAQSQGTEGNLPPVT